MQAGNDLRQIRLRKYENILSVSGGAVIAFGAWSIIKGTFYMILQPFDLDTFFTQEEIAGFQADLGEHGATIAGGMVVGFIFIALLLDLALRVYIGRSAISDGRRRKKKRITYVIVAAILAITTAIGTITSIYSIFAGTERQETAADKYLDSAFTSIFLDLTALLALIELVIAAIMVRRLRRELAIEPEECRETPGNLEEEATDIMEETGLGV